MPSAVPYRGGTRSVPSSPTAKHASKRSNSTLPSPRKPSFQSVNSPSPSCPQSPSAPSHQSVASITSLFPQTSSSTSTSSPKYQGDKVKLSCHHSGTQIYRPLVWLAVILFCNYLGYSHPFLWSSQERAAIFDYVTSTVPTLGSLTSASHRSPSEHGRILAQLPEDTQLSLPGEVDLGEVSSDPEGQEMVESTGNEGVVQVVTTTTTTTTTQIRTASEDGEGSMEGAGTPVLSTSPYTTPWTINVPMQGSCQKIYPRQLVKANQGPITYVGDLVRKRQRLLLSIPRHGLGNSLRGYVSSFVYAAVSGRRLVRFHGAEHAKVFDTLCHAFNCGLESISGDDAPGGAMGLYKQLEMLNPVDLNSKFKTSSQVVLSFRATRGLFVSKSPHFFDGFWQYYPQVKTCVYDAFGCSSTWCVHSRAIQALLGPPTPLLESVISKILMQHTTGKAAEDDVPAQRPVTEMFDIALHLRTRPVALESKNPVSGEESNQALMRIGCGLKDTAEASQYLKACLWDCLGGIFKKVEAERKGLSKGKPLQILLATDNEALRPAFVERLSQYGTVFYSSGVIAHSSKSASDEAERLPTMAEFHLMSRSHMILEAGSYISTFAYFSGLLGNGTLAGIDWRKDETCGLRIVHEGELVQAS